jgi:cellulose synthase operon protein C
VRTLNVRLAVILLVILVVGGAGAYFIHKFQQKHNAVFFLEQAEVAKLNMEKAQKEGNSEEQLKALKKQIENMRWYLSLKPKDMDVMESMGLLMADNVIARNLTDERSFGSAYGYLDIVIREDPSRDKVRRRLIDLMMASGRITDAQDHLTYLLKKSPDDPELLRLLGNCQEYQGEDEKAKTSYEKAIEYAPTNIDTYPLLADLLHKRLKQPKEAEQCLKKLVENNPDSAKAYIYLGAYYQNVKSNEEATKAVEKALELAPDDKDVSKLTPDDKNVLLDGLLLAARCAIESKDLEKAGKYAEHSLEINKQSEQAYATLTDIYNRDNKKEKALETLEKGLKETNNASQLLWAKANLLIDDKKLDAAKETVNKLRTANIRKCLVDFLEAKIAYTDKNWADAARRFEDVRPELASMPTYLLQTDMSLGYCYGMLHNSDKQMAAYQRVLAADPLNLPARQGLTNALLAANKIDEAVAEYSNLIRSKKMPPSGLIGFANLLIVQNMQRPAKDQNWKQVSIVLDEAEKLNPDAFQIPLQRVQALLAQDLNDEADKVLQKAHEKYPKQSEIWSAMVMVASIKKDWDKAEKILADYEKQMGDSIEYRLGRAEYFLRRYDANAGEHLKKLSENIDGFSEADRLKLWNGLLNGARRTGDKALIKQLTDLLAQKDVNNLEIQFMRVDQAANSQDQAAVEEVLKDVEKIEGQGPLWLFGNARLLALRAQTENNPSLLDEALQNLQQASEKRPSWSRVPLFMATIYDLQKKSDLALQFYKNSIDMGDPNPVAVRRSVQLLFQKQRYKDADNLLQQVDRMQIRITPEITQLWAQLLLQQGKFDLGIAKAREAVSEKSTDYADHLWLGKILSLAAQRAKEQNQSKDFKSLSAEAEQSLRRAVELKPDVAETWVSLVKFLSFAGKTSEAADVINQAREKIPADLAPIALAQCYEDIEKNDLAIEQYRLAIAAKPDDAAVVCTVADFYQRIGKTVEAEALLNRIIDGKVKAEKNNLFWARRQLALITAARGGLTNTENARKLIEQNLAEEADSTDDLRLKARLSANDPRLSRKEEAIGILSQMMEGQVATPEDRFRLALLYLGIEKQMQARPNAEEDKDNKDTRAWDDANTILRNLITSQNADSRYMAFYAKNLIDHGDIPGAELIVNKMTAEYRNAAATVVLQAELMAHRNKFEEALDLMKSFVDMKNAIPEDRSLRIKIMADAMEKTLDRLKAPEQKTMAERYLRTAEMYYRQYADEHPSQALDLALFFLRQDQTDDALDVLQKTWQNSDPTTVAQVCINLFNKRKDSKEIAEKVEKVLTDARLKFENHPAIVLTLGDLRFGQDRYTESEKFYREILEKNPGHSVAMNNLAVLLTVQNKKLDEALSLINKAIEITGPIASMLDTRACVYIAQDNAEKAISDMNEAVADNPSPVRLFNLARALNLGNQKNAAAAAMQKALKAGLTADMLHTLEKPAFDKLQNLAKQHAASEQGKQ